MSKTQQNAQEQMKQPTFIASPAQRPTALSPHGLLVISTGDGTHLLSTDSILDTVTGQDNVKKQFSNNDYYKDKAGHNVAFRLNHDKTPPLFIKCDLADFQEKYIKAFQGQTVHIADTTLTEAQRKEQVKLNAKKIEEYKESLIAPSLPNTLIGQYLEGKGIYLGGWAPKDEEHKSLNKIFDLYAAPTDLVNWRGKPHTLTFNEIVKHIAALQNWHGHDGEWLTSATDLYNSLKSSNFDSSGWFIPPTDVLERIQKHKNEGALKETITAHSRHSSKNMRHSISPYRIEANGGVLHKRSCIDIQTGYLDWGMDHVTLITRPVRAELRRPARGITLPTL